MQSQEKYLQAYRVSILEVRFHQHTHLFTVVRSIFRVPFLVNDHGRC